MNDQPNPTERAILKTLLYGDLFDFPLTLAEIHHFMIEHPASLDHIQSTLEQSDFLARYVVRSNGYYTTRPETADLRHQRDAISLALFQKAQHYGRWIAVLPFVRMVALTGALAMRNASHPKDDLDYLIITTPGRVWLTRLFVVGLVRLARLWGAELCPNYMLSETQLIQERQDLYIAHELTQMVPISGHEVYQKMRAVNTWADALMPNARGVFYVTPAHQPGGWLQRGGEWLLGGKLGDWLEKWERHRKTPKLHAEAQQSSHSAAVINPEQVKGHFNDYGHPILRRFYAKLKNYNLDTDEGRGQ